MPPKALVLYGNGINCEDETIFALNAVGFSASLLHITDLLKTSDCLKLCQMLVVPGGFSFADEIRSGKVLALELKNKLLAQLNDFIEQGKFLLGICNGFQVLTQLGVLPDHSLFTPHSAALIDNKSGKFSNRWVKLVVNEKINSPFLAGLETMTLPIRHGEGQLVVKEDLAKSISQYACLRYEEDVNGSFDRIAALTNKKGNVFGIMPHPEAFMRFSQHPAWTRKANMGPEENLVFNAMPDGLIFFQNAFRASNS